MTYEPKHLARDADGRPLVAARHHHIGRHRRVFGFLVRRWRYPMSPVRSMARFGLIGLALVALVVGVALALGGCSNPPSTGVVTSKKFTPSYTWYQQVCISYGKYGCQMYMPFPVTEPDEYQMCLRADAGDTQHDRTGCWDTDPQTYARYQPGDHYPDGR